VGDWEGRSFAELQGELGFFQGMMRDEHHRAPNGESRLDVTTRFVAAVEEFRANHAGQNIVVVAHGVAIAFALAHWLEHDSARWTNYRLHNTAVSSVDLARGKLEFLNRTDHL
jgi:broad specificity phosphatase PhoE